MPEQKGKPPVTHLAIIMDGNGRWAGQRGLPRSAGHKAGTDAVREIVKECRRVGISFLTLYAFSKENWNRPKEEVNFLFDLLLKFLKQEHKTLLERSIRLNILGEWSELPFATRQMIKMVLQQTRECDQMVLNLALNYSGRDEILRACRELLAQGINPAELTEEVFQEYLYTAGQPDPDLIIRTSGEQRLSNYLLFQSAYSEFYFTPTLWPDFGPEDLHAALHDYARRERRFGAVGQKKG